MKKVKAIKIDPFRKMVHDITVDVENLKDETDGINCSSVFAIATPEHYNFVMAAENQKINDYPTAPSGFVISNHPPIIGSAVVVGMKDAEYCDVSISVIDFLDRIFWVSPAICLQLLQKNEQQ